MQKVLLAGVSGYLGGYIAQVLREGDWDVRAIVRKSADLSDNVTQPNEVIVAELTQPDTIQGCCEGIDLVISSVGITRQKDGLTYMAVDYQANLNLLEEARRSGVKKFIYVSAFGADQLTHLKICAAKEGFVDALKNSGLSYAIIRPNGFFSDMTDFHRMAQKGRVFLFGDGHLQMNPIHGEDVARVCVEAMGLPGNQEISVGGPEVLTHNAIARMAFEALNKPPKITHLPNWLRTATLWLTRTCCSSRTYGPIEFALTVLGRDMLAPCDGKHRLKAYFEELGA